MSDQVPELMYTHDVPSAGTAATAAAVSCVAGAMTGTGFNPVADASQEFRPQMMLTLLSYCYAAGICGSQDIEWAAQSDKTVRYICAGKEPDWLTIRRFRRRNAELLRQCLAYILKHAWASRANCGSSSEPIIDWSESNFDHQIDCSVRNRIDAAIFLDAVANDF